MKMLLHIFKASIIKEENAEIFYNNFVLFFYRICENFVT